MADKITRTFWIVPGVVDEKTKKPVEFPTLEQAQAQSGIGLGPHILAKTPVQVDEEMTDDGEYTQTATDPQTGKQVVLDRGVDKNQLALSRQRVAAANTAADNARAEQAKQPAPQTPDQARLTKAQADAAERAATPPTVTRSTAGGGAESVTTTQAEYDRQVAQDQRQALIDAQTRADKAAEQARQAALDRIASERWSAEQANTAYQRDLDKIHLELQRDTLALTRRGQDLSAETSRRGQDISAGVSQRGQDLDFQGGLVRNATGLAQSLIPGFAQPEQWSAVRQQINNTLKIGGQPQLPDFQGGPPPYDPLQFTQQAAQMALGQTPSPYVLPGGAPPVPQTPYVLPPS